MKNNYENKEIFKKIRITILVLLFLTSIPVGVLFYGYLKNNKVMTFTGLGITIFFLLVCVILSFLVNYLEDKTKK